MDYKSLNDNNKKRINSICSSNIEMNWEDPDILDIILGELPRIRESRDDSKLIKELSTLKKFYNSYDYIKTDKSKFLEQLKNQIEEIRLKFRYWYGLDANQVETCLNIQKACIMRGNGGAGKTYFTMKLEEKLSSLEIPHLCIYGKFENNLEHVDFEEIDSLSKEQRFVFVVDAIYEMNYESQINLCNQLKNIVQNKGLQILITYRNKTIDKTVEKMLNSISYYDYNFLGVSYESAIESMLRLGIPDVYKYEDILFSNNALLLSNLMAVLDSDVIKLGKKNNIATITYIMENGGIKSRIGKSEWEKTKIIATWMLEQESHTVPVETLATLIKNSDLYISMMEQNGYISIYSYSEKPSIYFTSETLIDYLIARSMLTPLSEMPIEDGIEYIKRKISAIPGIREALIISLFDKYKNNFELLKKIMVDTDLIDDFTSEVLVKIRFEKEDILPFLDVFKAKKPMQWFLYVGGYSDKPYNCTTFFNTYLINNDVAHIELTNILDEKNYLGNVIGRLKNLIYYVAYNGVETNGLNEAGYFALWCSAAPNRTVRHYSMKLLYDVASKDDRFRHSLTELVFSINDPYIVEAIIYTLAYCDPGIKADTKECFQKLMKDKSFISARDLKRISTYMGDPHMYIKLDKMDLYKRNDSMTVSEEFQQVLITVDLMDKYMLPFRYWGHDDYREFDLFADLSKEVVSELNYDLNNNYECLKNHYGCRNSNYFKEYLFNLYDIDTSTSLDNKIFASSYERMTRDIFKFFGYTLEDNKRIFHRDFSNSAFRKLIDISTDYFLGSIMCNYYKNNFHCYDGEENWGFEIYDPLPYKDSEEINIASPLPLYNTKVERIESALLDRIELPEDKNDNWHNDFSITKKNLLNLIKPIIIDEEEWVLLAGNFSPEEQINHTIEWRDTYVIYCCTSNEKNISGRGDRYLTIEIPEYTGNINYYYMCSDTPELCNNVRNITTTDDFEDSTLVLPPAEIVAFYNLKPNYKDMSWVDQDGNAIILCDNCKKSYFKDPANGLVMMNKKAFDEYLKHKPFKYFAFTERLIHDRGYSDETCFHYELQDGKIIKQFANKNQEDYEVETDESDDECKNCPYNLYEKRLEYGKDVETSYENFLEALNSYAPIDWEE